MDHGVYRIFDRNGGRHLMNVWDIVVGAVIILIIAAAVYLNIRRKKKGGCCGGSCCQCDGCKKSNKNK